jgi:hypothetical protein
VTSHFETRQRRRERGLLDDEPRCSKCDGLNERAPQRYCVACNREYQREWKRSRAMVPRESLTEEQAKRLRPRRGFI